MMQTIKAYSEPIFMYAADQQLASLLLIFGLIEKSLKLDAAKDKRRFKKTQNARKSIYFYGRIMF